MTTLENCHVFWVYLALAKMAEQHGPLRIALRCYADCLGFVKRLREDELDFHHFTLRGGRLIHFERMMSWMNGLAEFRGPQEAAVGLIRCMIRLSREQEGLLKEMPLEAQHLTAAGLAAIKDREQKAAYDAAYREQVKRHKGIRRVAEKNFGLKDPEVDVDGWRMLETKDPLGYAGKLAKDLAQHESPSIDTLEAQVDVALLRGKVLQAVSALLQAHELCPASPRVALLRVRVLQAAREALDREQPDEGAAAGADPGAATGGAAGGGAGSVSAKPLRASAKAALVAALEDERVSGGFKDASGALAGMSGEGKGSLAWRLARGRAAVACGQDASAACSAVLGDGSSLPAGCTWQEADEAVRFLGGLEGGEEAAGSLRALARGAFPRADAFASE